MLLNYCLNVSSFNKILYEIHKRVIKCHLINSFGINHINLLSCVIHLFKIPFNLYIYIKNNSFTNQLLDGFVLQCIYIVYIYVYVYRNSVCEESQRIHKELPEERQPQNQDQRAERQPPGPGRLGKWQPPPPEPLERQQPQNQDQPGATGSGTLGSTGAVITTT